MTDETRIEIVSHAIRWAANMLGEVASNHGSILPPDVRDNLQRGLHELWETDQLIRQHLAKKSAARKEEALRRGSKALRRAWDLFQNSGVMREPDGKTGSPELDELGNLLDEMAAFDAALANTEEK
jgi:hypothetical protein